MCNHGKTKVNNFLFYTENGNWIFILMALDEILYFVKFVLLLCIVCMFCIDGYL